MPTEYLRTQFYALYGTYNYGRTYNHTHNFFKYFNLIIYIYVKMMHETTGAVVNDQFRSTAHKFASFVFF